MDKNAALRGWAFFTSTSFLFLIEHSRSTYFPSFLRLDNFVLEFFDITLFESDLTVLLSLDEMIRLLLFKFSFLYVTLSFTGASLLLFEDEFVTLLFRMTFTLLSLIDDRGEDMASTGVVGNFQFN